MPLAGELILAVLDAPWALAVLDAPWALAALNAPWALAVLDAPWAVVSGSGSGIPEEWPRTRKEGNSSLKP
jgi:hypothetical protein